MNKLYRRTVRLQGFSLIEIMIVIALIGIIIAALAVYLPGRLEKGRIDSAKVQAQNIDKALEMFNIDFGRYPTTEEGLEMLVNPPRGKPYLPNLPKDPWGHEYAYVHPGAKNGKLGRPDVRSLGPDGVESDDDIGNWTEEADTP